ncbi:bifunctional folylpolyglutamate synthase/dihydrofolate synthase [Viridibacillus arvi]|uniref:bifunctional folylpolyglutamate synthase/dihydrofolate synthase n=1 Tax=Viridibacillus arvi TaxID=263475 RepID=UPI00187BC0BC|nr:folylpolyglutamate synthase/dihydrofolate synthase family protein [Viridibacillus sp. JNUCC-6]QOV12861.1 bifunctional folylpolyglutamate synthase/dihydrofolate synthase [Viridibacillus sp. JNUCC-6]
MIPKLDYYKEKWGVRSDASIKPGLTAITEALQLVGNPQENLSAVHVAGTNGKGSTITFIEHISKAHGLSTATFMSPCIEDVHDQIQLDEQPITSEEMDAVFKIMADAGLDGKLTDFELLTVAAFLAFERFEPDITIIECGMGGRFDSTNVVKPIVSVVPSIALEHTNFLGSTIESIAMHKSGIIKEGKPVVTGVLPTEAMEIFKQEAEKLCSPLLVYNENYTVIEENSKEIYMANDVRIPNLTRTMPGLHQRSNMALAITAFNIFAQVNGVKTNVEAFRNGVQSAQLACRFELLAPKLYIDGAHNPASAKSLVDAIQEQFPNEPIHFIVGMLGDKDIRGVLAELEKVGTTFTFVDVANDRAMAANEIMKMSNTVNKSTTYDILTTVQQKLLLNEVIIMTGSLYLLAKWRKILHETFN